MPFIDVREVRAKIAFHEAQLEALKKLLKLSDILSEKGAGGRRGAETISRAGRDAKGDGRKRGRRGMLSGSITALLENSRGALTAGAIKNALLEQGVIEKGSTTVYAMLLQMAKRGVIKKMKTAEGMTYAIGSGAGKAAKGGRAGRPRGRKKSAPVQAEQTATE